MSLLLFYPVTVTTATFSGTWSVISFATTPWSTDSATGSWTVVLGVGTTS